MVEFQPLYCPALRLKSGELAGLRNLAPDIANRVLPRLIVPPSEERGDDQQMTLIVSEASPDISGPLAASWYNRDAFIDATHIYDEFGRDRVDVWLPHMFDRMRKSGVKAIPLLGLSDLVSIDSAVIRGIIDTDAVLKFGVIVSSGELVTQEPLENALAVLAKIGLQAENCAIIADFHDSDFTNADIVASIIGGVLEMIQASARWQRVIFQGTNYPEKNPSDPGSHAIVPRNEWLAWRKAVRLNPQTAEHMIFGDYAADCAKMNFGGRGGIARRHLRYATSDAWVVHRGANDGKHDPVMRSVSSKIVQSTIFAGRGFSSADNSIYLMASGQIGPGTASQWRALNTTHHLTRVVTDLGQVRGVAFEEKSHEPVPEQVLLF